MKLTEQINLDAAAKTARRAYRKNLPKAVRKASRASGWRCSQGDLFREMDGWFIFASLSVNLLRHETRLRFTAKPMKIDDIFWDITDLQENASQPLSFRVFGAWTCGCPSLYDAEIRESDDSSDLDDIATRFVAQSDKYLASIQSSTLEAVLQLCLGVPYPANYLAAEVAILVMMGKPDKACDLCEQARAAGESGGFMSGRRRFPEMALDWLDANSMDCIGR